ncbi:DUF6282 family protein [Zhaonella formicivorans]|uniref:DUF6282 family protein n=1 Tax=Zhaonella formicivorans TaxID=2528593 RepID=UPI0010EC7E6D|nr:DUF6282 family protein [Zhaonella formicivorans]
MLISLEGAYDLHVHTHPCLFPRLCDDRAAVTAAAQAGLAGMMLKCHHESTVSRARELQREFDNFKVFGGIVLNEYVGGINPQAVEAALKMGAKEVWMPTIDADNHAKAHGSKGKYDVQEGGSTGDGSEIKGVNVLDSEGNINRQTKEVLKLVAEFDVILGTCHLSPDEIYKLVKAAKELGVKKILITHPFFKVPALSVSQLKELVAMGAKAEFGYCTVSPMWHYATVQEVTAALKEIGAENAIIISDAGQRHNPMPHESLRVFAQCLYECGMSKEELRLLMVDNPKALLNL